jgi:ribosomal protein S18 acetylase RimI-like enzyme
MLCRGCDVDIIVDKLHIIRPMDHGRIEIRDAMPQDIAQLSEVYHYAQAIAFPKNPGLSTCIKPADMKEDRAMMWKKFLICRIIMIFDPCSFFRVAVNNGRVIGYVTTATSAQRESLGEITNLYIDPWHWERGIGTALLREAETLMKGFNKKGMMLGTELHNKRARNFYDKRGWVEQGIMGINGELFVEYRRDFE